MIFYMVDHSNRRNLKRWLSHGPQRISNFLLSQGENLPHIESKLLGLSKKFLEVLSMTFFCKMKYDHNKNEVTSRFHWKISGAIDSSMYNGHGKLVQTLTYVMNHDHVCGLSSNDRQQPYPPQSRFHGSQCPMAR